MSYASILSPPTLNDLERAVRIEKDAVNAALDAACPPTTDDGVAPPRRRPPPPLAPDDAQVLPASSLLDSDDDGEITHVQDSEAVADVVSLLRRDVGRFSDSDDDFRVGVNEEDFEEEDDEW